MRRRSRAPSRTSSGSSADAENDARWRTGVAEISRVSGEGVGAKYHQSIKGPTGKPVDADFEITELEPNKLIAFRTTSGPVRPIGRYELTPEGAGTRVHFTLKAELSGLKKAATPIVQKALATRGCRARQPETNPGGRRLARRDVEPKLGSCRAGTSPSRLPPSARSR